MPIREATEADIPRIVELGSQSLLDGPYKGVIQDNPEQAARLAVNVLQAAKGRILLYENDEQKVVGLLAFIIYPQIFTGELTANEIMWYMQPDERKGCGALKLLWAAEKLAKHLGAIYMGFTSPTAEVSKIYERFGYKMLEVAFLRKL